MPRQERGSVLRASSRRAFTIGFFLLQDLALSTVGCQSQDTGDTFEISADRTSNSCGSGAVDATKEWEGNVSIEVEGDNITWTEDQNGKTLEGTVSDDSFLITDSWTTVISEGTEAAPGCSVTVRVRYVGTLDGTSGDIENIDGEMSISYTEVSGSDCSALIGANNGFDELPCEVTYAFDGDRTD